MKEQEDPGFEILWCDPPKDEEYEEPSDEQRRFVCVEKLPWGNWKCWSPHCPDHAYRSKGRHASKTKKSKPKSKGVLLWAITLPVGKYMPSSILRRVRQDFNRRLRRLIGEWEYWYVLHKENSGRYNLHLLAKSTKANIRDDVKEQWAAAMQRQGKRSDLGGTFYVHECYSMSGYIDYCLQRRDEDDPQSKMPPRHLYKRYTGKTKGFDTL